MALQTRLPAQMPPKNSVFSDVLNIDGLKDASSLLSVEYIESLLSTLPSLNTINHAIAKKIPVFTQKSLVLIITIKNQTHLSKKIQALQLIFNYDVSFYNHIIRQGFSGVFYDKKSKAIYVNVQDNDAIEWLGKNIKDYFQVVINLTTHQFLYTEDRPRLRKRFVPISKKINPVTIWLNQLELIIRQFVPADYPTVKIELHDGNSFKLMPKNFFLVCYVDILLIKHESGHGIFNYLVIDVLNPENNKAFKGVKNKDITISISRYMDACNFNKIKPYTVKESKCSST